MAPEKTLVRIGTEWFTGCIIAAAVLLWYLPWWSVVYLLPLAPTIPVAIVKLVDASRKWQDRRL